MTDRTPDAPGSRRDAPRRPLSRRTLLGALGAGFVGGLAGCSADDDSPGGARDADPDIDPDADGGTASPADPADPDEVERVVRGFVDRLAAGDFAGANAMFSGGLARSDPERLRATWTGLTTQHGPFAGVGSLDRRVRGENTAVRVRLAFAAADATLNLVLNEDAGIFAITVPTPPVEPPAYADPDALVETPVVLEDADCPLRGVLALPRGDDPVPGAVVVHRAGPRDRDGSVGPNRPYRDLAWGLASRGVATLRYDKRTAACDLDIYDQTLDAVVVDDALAALGVLRGHERVRADATVVVGHGLGGAVTPLIAEHDGALAGTVLAAANARPLPESLLASERRKAAADGRVTEAERERLAFVERRLDRLDRLGPDEEFFVLGTATTYWRDLMAYDQVATLRALDSPTLVLQGGRDFQVGAEDFGTWRDALAGRDATFRRYPDLDHLFMRVFGPSLPEAYLFPDNVAREPVEDVAAWVHRVASGE